MTTWNCKHWHRQFHTSLFLILEMHQRKVVKFQTGIFIYGINNLVKLHVKSAGTSRREIISFWNWETLCSNYKEKTWAPHAELTLICQGPLFYLKSLVKNWHNSNILLSELCSLSCNCLLVMMSKHAKYVLLPWVMGYIKNLK